MATLVQGLEREAEKKGLTGAEKHRYIGGAIRNMEKRGEITIHRKPAAPKPVKASHKAHTPTPVRKPAPAPAPAKKPYSKPTVTKTVSRPAPAPTKKVAYTPPAVTRREPLELIVKRRRRQRGEKL
jgi:cell division septation protein DedD